MCNKIAVYGTLRYGGPANGFLEGAKRIGTDTVPAKLYGLGWFPGVKLDPEAETVVDVYEIPNDAEYLREIDRYEGYTPGRPEESLFKRTKVLLNSNNEEVYLYEYCHEVNEENLIETGDWLKQDGY